MGKKKIAEFYVKDDSIVDIHMFWQDVSVGMFTPGGDPVYACPKCGKDRHLGGVEMPDFHNKCRNCGVELRYPWER